MSNRKPTTRTKSEISNCNRTDLFCNLNDAITKVIDSWTNLKLTDTRQTNMAYPWGIKFIFKQKILEDLIMSVKYNLYTHNKLIH